MVNWLSVSQNSGNGSTVITITASTNEELTARTAAIVVSAATLTASTSVSQLGRSATLVSVSPTSIHLTHNSGQTVLSIVSNGAWHLTSCPVWLYPSVTAGTGNASIQFTYAENTEPTAFTGTITVSTADDAASATVTQDGFAWLSSSTQSLSYVAAGASSAVTISSNGAWVVDSYPAWIVPSVTSGTGTQSVTFTALANTQFDERGGDITFRSSDMTLTIPATQERALRTLSVEPASYEFGFNGGSLVITAETNSNWTIATKPNWITLSSMSGPSGVSYVTATCAYNTDYADRSGSIVFRNDDTEDYIIVSQDSFIGVTVTYNITNTGETRILNHFATFDSMSVDGGEYEAVESCYYDFDEIGDHTITFKLTGDTLNQGWVKELGWQSRTIISDMRYDLIKDVTIHPGVRVLDACFPGQTALSAITFEQPCMVEEIGRFTFQMTYSLTGFTIPSTVKTIKAFAFFESGLRNIVVPSSVTNENLYGEDTWMMFANSNNLQTAVVECPGPIDTVNWFYQCPNLQSVVYNSIGGVNQNATSGMCESCTTLTYFSAPNLVQIGPAMLHDCPALTTAYTPSATYIGYNAFQGDSSLSTGLTINENITFIGVHGFSQCSSLTRFDLSNASITGISNYAFYGCSSLEEVKLPPVLSSIGNYAFQYCTSLSAITSLAYFAPSITSYTFYYTYTGGTLYVPSGRESAYSNWTASTGNQRLINWTIAPYSPTDLEIPNCFHEVSWLYAQTGVAKPIDVYSPDANYSVVLDGMDFTVSGTPASGLSIFLLSSNTVNTGVTDITGTITFTRGSTSIPITLKILPASESYDLSMNYEITTAGTQSINRSGTSSQGYMFVNDVVYPISNQFNFDSVGTYNIKYAFNDHVVPDKLFLYESGHEYTMPSTMEFGKYLTAFGDQAFDGSSWLSGDLVIPKTVSSFGYHALADTNLRSVKFECDTVSGLTWGTYLFYNSKHLEKVEFQPDTLVGLSDGAYFGCTILSSVTTPSIIRRIGSQAFYGCSGLTSMTIPSTVVSLGDYIMSSSKIRSIYSYPKTAPTGSTNTFQTWNYILSGGTVHVQSGASGYNTDNPGWYTLLSSRYCKWHVSYDLE